MNVPRVIGATVMLPVKIQMDRIHVHVLMVILEMESLAQMSMNARSTVTTVMPTRNALTHQDHIPASVTMRLTTMETGQRAILSEDSLTQKL